MSSIELSTAAEVKSVLLAYDFSETSQKPLHHAIAIARHFGAKFYLAHVVAHVGYTIAGAEALQLVVERTQRDAQHLEKELSGDGQLGGVPHEFLVRQGNVWEQLDQIIRAKKVDVVVVGTHGRGGLGKLLLGSSAENIFRHANCLVVTVGPGASMDSLIEKTEEVRPFLFATDFGAASLHALPQAISFANHFGARLALLHVLPAAPIPDGFHWSSTGDLAQMREKSRLECQSRLQACLSQNPPLRIEPEFLVKFGSASDQILLASHALKADLIVMGLHRSAHIATASHMPWDVAYKVVCGAHCPVLTARN